jgi:hypothetical protein
VVEEIPDYKNAEYQQALYNWRVQIWREQLRAIAAAITFSLTSEARQKLEALQAIGMGTGTDADFLRFCVCEADQAAIVEAVYYQSTVTQRGIAEAEERLNYTWRDKPLSIWTVGYTYGKRGALAVDMRAAFRSGLTWQQFCALSGQEQSLLVAFWSLEERLNWLSSNGN